MGQEIHNQVEDLPAFARELGKHDRFRNLDPSRMIFTGSGDSFASSLFAHYLSEMQAFAADPYELQLHPRVAKNKTIFITSVSGKTRTNIQLAKRVKGIAKKRVAITANPESPLAEECDDLIQIRYRCSGILTSGTASFSATLLAVASLIRRLPKLDSLPVVERGAAEWARRLRVHPRGEFLFVGWFWGCRLNTSIQSSLGIPSFSHSKRNQTISCSYRRARTRRRVKCFEFSRRMVYMRIC